MVLESKRRRRSRGLVALLLILITTLSLLWGRYPAPGLLNPFLLETDPVARALFFNIRIPRVVSALVLGAVLSVAGTVLQTVLANPLVEPGLLGVSQGAAFGAALAILFGGGAFWSVPLTAAAFGLIGLALSWNLARRIRYGGAILRLVLSGVVVSALFSSGLGVLKSLADPLSELPEITFWMMGGLSAAGWEAVLRTVPVVAVCLALISLVRWRINLHALDDRSAFALGSDPGRERLILVVLAVIAVAAVTAVAGIVSWVGLLIPHLSRKLEGADTARNLPTAMMLGAAFVLICDDIARGLLTGEIPLGLLTALGGAVLFAVLMTRRERSVA